MSSIDTKKIPLIIGAFFIALTLIGLISLLVGLRHKPGPEPDLWRPIPHDLERMDCSRGGIIKSIQEINQDFEVLLVHCADDPDDVNWGALANKQDNFKIGSYVQICYVDVLNASRGRTYNMVGLAKRDQYTKYPFDSELEKYEQCEKDLEQCNKDLVGVYDTCTKHLEKSK